MLVEAAHENINLHFVVNKRGRRPNALTPQLFDLLLIHDRVFVLGFDCQAKFDVCFSILMTAINQSIRILTNGFHSKDHTVRCAFHEVTAATTIENSVTSEHSLIASCKLVA